VSNKPNLLLLLDILTPILVLTATLLVFFYAPLEIVMGMVQKIFYFHVASNWAGMLGFFVAVIGGIIYLRTGNLHWDIIGVSAVELGMVFMLIGIITGSIWARPTWNTWWTWDPRLTTITIVELIYAAYFLLRQGMEEAERRARFSAVYAIAGFLSVPLTFFSIRFARTIHPILIGSSDPTSQGAFDMTSPMVITFIVSLVAFSFLFSDLLWHRFRLGELAQQVELKKNERGG
jgi:heme exporter protein C